MSAPPRPVFSPGNDDEAALAQALSPLLGARWSLTPSGEGLERAFKFKTFARTWDFMTAVSLECKLKNHHPEWSNVYNTTFIRWTTHTPRGLSQLDVVMAAACDRIARDFGEIAIEAGAEIEASSKGLVDSVVAATAGDCCGPK